MIVSQLWQYPVKGLAGITLDSIRLEAGKHFPGDRRFAVTNGHPKQDEALAGHWVKKSFFLQMMKFEELAAYDTANLIVGVLGGAAGTTRDTFELVAQTERFGGRVALFGRKIYLAEDAIEIVRLMRAIVEGGIGTIDAVKSYHDTVKSQGTVPSRTILEDLEVTDPILRPEAE